MADNALVHGHEEYGAHSQQDRRKENPCADTAFNSEKVGTAM